MSDFDTHRDCPTPSACESHSVCLGDCFASSCSAKVTRKAFICMGCEGVYADEPVTACDCCIDLDLPKGAKWWIEGEITYTKQNEES